MAKKNSEKQEKVQQVEAETKTFVAEFPCQVGVRVRGASEEEAMKALGEYLTALNMVSKSVISPLTQPVLKEVKENGE